MSNNSSRFSFVIFIYLFFERIPNPRTAQDKIHSQSYHSSIFRPGLDSNPKTPEPEKKTDDVTMSVVAVLLYFILRLFYERLGIIIYAICNKLCIC